MNEIVCRNWEKWDIMLDRTIKDALELYLIKIYLFYKDKFEKLFMSKFKLEMNHSVHYKVMEEYFFSICTIIEN